MLGRAPGPARTALVGALALVVALGALWHASPWLLWKLRFEAQLAAEGDARRLRSTLWTPRSAPVPEWPRLVSGDLSLRAPLAREALAACGRCATECRLPLDNRGTLGLFAERSSESYREALDRYAPDARDVSLWRSVASNWHTIDALTDRVRNATEPSASFRFESPGSRGVVTAFRVGGVPRFVVYAYAPDGSAARILGVAGLERARFAGVLGGLRIEPEHAQRASRCAPGE